MSPRTKISDPVFFGKKLIRQPAFLWIFLMFSIALALLSCDSGMSDPVCGIEPSGFTKYGTIRNDCGPTDGPEIRISFTDTVVSCTTGYSYPITSAQLHVNAISEVKIGPDSIYVGRDAWQCTDGNHCYELGKLDIHFTDSTATHMSGVYQIKKAGNVVESGRMELIKCVERPMCG